MQFTLAQLAQYNKGQYREACRAHGIGYTGLNNDGMRDALTPLATDYTGPDAGMVPANPANADAGDDQLVLAVPRVLPDLTAVPFTEPVAPKTPKVARVAQPEAHGVKRPKNGTICAQIWAWCDAQNGAGVRPEAKVLRAALPGLDDTTKTVQFYRWRKFNGISGR